MSSRPSQRLIDIADALPLVPGMRVLEIGCGPGVLARLIAERLCGVCLVLGIDRSAKAIAAARSAAASFPFAACLDFRQSAAETFRLEPGERPFDLAVAIRVGALDGRHPDAGVPALASISAALSAEARIFIDGGDPLKEIRLPNRG